MPGFDKTGPNGQGTGTGRRRGPCFSRDYQCSPVGAQRQRGGMGRGMQRGLRFRQNVEAVGEETAEMQKSENTRMNELEERMSVIECKLDQLITAGQKTTPESRSE